MHTSPLHGECRGLKACDHHLHCYCLHFHHGHHWDLQQQKLFFFFPLKQQQQQQNNNSVYINFTPQAGTLLLLSPSSGELRTQKLRSRLLRTQSLKVLPLKPGVGQYIAIHAAALTARDFFLANFYPSSPFACIFSKTSPEFFLC